MEDLESKIKSLESEKSELQKRIQELENKVSVPNHKDVVEALQEKNSQLVEALRDMDTDLALMEDALHGTDYKLVSEVRSLIDKALNLNPNQK